MDIIKSLAGNLYVKIFVLIKSNLCLKFTRDNYKTFTICILKPNKEMARLVQNTVLNWRSNYYSTTHGTGIFHKTLKVFKDVKTA